MHLLCPSLTVLSLCPLPQSPCSDLCPMSPVTVSFPPSPPICPLPSQSSVPVLCPSPLSQSSVPVLCPSPLSQSSVPSFCPSPLSQSSVLVLCPSPLPLSPQSPSPSPHPSSVLRPPNLPRFWLFCVGSRQTRGIGRAVNCGRDLCKLPAADLPGPPLRHLARPQLISRGAI